MTHEPLTLGDKLEPVATLAPVEKRTPVEPQTPEANSGVGIVRILLDISLLTVISALLLWWLLLRPDMDRDIMLVLLVTLIVLRLFVRHLPRVARHPEAIAWHREMMARRHERKPRRPEGVVHPLLANDRQGFMRNLRLDTKTAIFDGSNIYHFGRKNGVDAIPLGAIARQLRAEGYRIVCFFDANIFYTLNEHGAFPSGQQHSLMMLEDIFGLGKDEIYVVPSRTQADKYVLDSLKHLPISFAVTNDQFRDYAKKYPTVMKGNQWRKGVAISNGELKLHQHRFQKSVLLN